MKKNILFLLMLLCLTIHAQRFEHHKVFLTNNGIGSQTIKVKHAKTFSIRKDKRVSWAKYQIGNGQVTFSSSANRTKYNRTCDFILINNVGTPVDTLHVIQAGIISTKTTQKVSTIPSSTKTTSSSTRTTRKSSSDSYGGQCAATTKKGRRCSRQASSGSIYCWQHQ